MAERIALKRLTASDLTFFESLFRSLNVGNQKSINLNADVFVQEFYPSLPDMVGFGAPDRILVNLRILGPDGASEYVLSRAITKRDAYKNWRLNGEFIWDPENQPGRFDVLSPNDLALIEFSGDPIPKEVSLLLIAQKSAVDAPLHSVLAPLIPGGRKTMIEISRQALATAIDGISPSHAIWAFVKNPTLEAALEDAAFGGLEGAEEISSVSKSVSAATLSAAKASAEKNGREGEAIVWSFLNAQMREGVYAEIQWVSRDNAISAYDFLVKNKDGSARLLEVKSTSGEFSNKVHISIAELKAAKADKAYDLWRVYRIDDEGACLKISESISDFAASVLKGLAPPDGVTVDSISVDPNVLTWKAEIPIERQDEPDDDE
ncbi:MAG: DUF3883 domain-containing protein [Pseudolabrys sp.]